MAQVDWAMHYKKRYFTKPKVPEGLKFYELINLSNQCLWNGRVTVAKVCEYKDIKGGQSANLFENLRTKMNPVVFVILGFVICGFADPNFLSDLKLPQVSQCILFVLMF